jgi:uncharacterized membrane protein
MDRAKVLALAGYGLAEYAYLSSTAGHYVRHFRGITGNDSLQFEVVPYGPLAYVLLFVAIDRYVFDRIGIQTTFQKAFLEGLLLGLVVYGVYNATNRVTFGPAWSERVLFQDLAWGALVMASVALLYRWLLSIVA